MGTKAGVGCGLGLLCGGGSMKSDVTFSELGYGYPDIIRRLGGISVHASPGKSNAE